MNSKLRSLLIRLSAFALILVISFLGTKALATGNISGADLTSPIISEGVDLAKLAGTVLGWLMALIIGLLWVITRLLSFVFRFTGGLMYGFFINNPLDTELQYIRPLWSFLVDFGNLIVIGSFIALALVILFDIDLPVSKDLGKFAGGIVMIALLLNFSLTITSAFASTIHSIGIGTVYATQSTAGSNLDLSSKQAFNKSVLLTGNKFFESVNNNFVEKVSCLGSDKVEYAASPGGKPETKGMAAVCKWHKKDEAGTLNPLTLVAASDGSPEAFTFYLVAIIREFVVLVLLAVGIFVLIKLLKVSVFRLAYLWMVGIFAGPALVAAFSPFDGMKKYFQTWLKWLVVFSTMMIVFIAGFYLSSYVATINLPQTATAFTDLPNPLSESGPFVNALVNSMIEVVVPNVMFPIIGLAILFLLGKYLDETYQQHAEKALKAGGKLVSDARSSVGGLARLPGRIGAGAMGAAGAAAGGLKNIQNVPSSIGSLKNKTLSMANQGLGAISTNDEARQRAESRAVRYAGKNAINQQKMANRNKGVEDFVSGKAWKSKQAELDYMGKMNNSEVLGRLGANTGAFAGEAKKNGVSDRIVNQGKAASIALKNNNDGSGTSLKERTKAIERDVARSENKNFDSEFASAKSKLLYDAIDQEQRVKKTHDKTLEDMKLKRDSEQESIKEKIKDITLKTADADERKKLISAQQSRSNNLDVAFDKQKAELEKQKKATLDDITDQRAKINVDSANNTVVTDVINQRYIAENPNVQEKITKQIDKTESRGINNTNAIAGRNQEAKDQFEQIEGQANAIFEQLKAIDNDSNVSMAVKKERKDNLLNSVASKNKQEVKRQAERKYKEFNSNPYGDE